MCGRDMIDHVRLWFCEHGNGVKVVLLHIFYAVYVLMYVITTVFSHGYVVMYVISTVFSH